MKKSKLKRDSSYYVEFLKHGFSRYRVVIFVVFVALVYGYVFLQINSFANARPSPLAIANQQHTSTAIPHIDQATVDKIQNLKDNSVNVQALFNQARDNPFFNN